MEWPTDELVMVLVGSHHFEGMGFCLTGYSGCSESETIAWCRLALGPGIGVRVAPLAVSTPNTPLMVPISIPIKGPRRQKPQ